MPSHRGRTGVVVALAAASALLTGCVERRYTIRTDPPGALVIVNGEPIGTTPVSRSYTFYGDRTLRVIKEGYTTMDVVEKFPAPLYDNLVTEFFTENLIPYRFRDEREFLYKLEPAVPDDAAGVLNRAEATRVDGQAPVTKRNAGVRGLFGF